MVEEKIPLVKRMRSFVSEFSDQVVSTDGKILFCRPCEIKINCEKRFAVIQDQHNNNLNNFNK